MRLLLSLAFAIALGACAPPPAPVDAASGGDAAVPTAFEPCDTICLRPSDCQPAYNDDGYCPAGFRCAARFSCAVDGGGD